MMSSISKDLYEEILKPKRVIQIVSYKSLRVRPHLDAKFRDDL